MLALPRWIMRTLLLKVNYVPAFVFFLLFFYLPCSCLITLQRTCENHMYFWIGNLRTGFTVLYIAVLDYQMSET